jgi:NitT/TauT family transport system permease protein
MQANAAPANLAEGEAVVLPPIAREKPATLGQRLKEFYLARRQLLLGLVSVSLMLSFWQFMVEAGHFDEFFASKPSAVAAAGWQLITRGTIGAELPTTLQGFSFGFGLAILLGVPLGILIGWYPTFFALCQPYIAGLNATPRLALYPLFVVWFGIGIETKIVIVFISSSLPILFNTISGVRNLDRAFIEVARCMGANDRQIFRTVALPASVPFIMSGLRLGLGHALLATIISELFVGSRGIGSLLNTYAAYFQTDRLMFLIVLVATTGIILLQVVQWIEQKVDFWRPRH